MAERSRTVVAAEVQDVLNYFGACPICGHPARARLITAQFADGRVCSQTVAECGGWCGWKGPVDATPMTGDAVVTAQGRNEIGAVTEAGDSGSCAPGFVVSGRS
ncbi:hypothetical protein ACFXK0_08465 [Nocardia sp. NPDC059177]|uniref:hypothetical protein n=1 Tax=Nocardia sp. NPDC059177 TaxID=3346759 RepID=UPI00367D7DED